MNPFRLALIGLIGLISLEWVQGIIPSRPYTVGRSTREYSTYVPRRVGKSNRSWIHAHYPLRLGLDVFLANLNMSYIEANVSSKLNPREEYLAKIQKMGAEVVRSEDFTFSTFCEILLISHRLQTLISAFYLIFPYIGTKRTKHS